MRRFLIISLLLMGAIVIGGCGQDAETDTSTPEEDLAPARERLMNGVTPPPSAAK